MAIEWIDAHANEAGSCNACSRLAGDPGGSRVRVLRMRPEYGNGSTEVRLCPTCRKEMAEALR